MTKRPDQLMISLGVDAVPRRAALEQLAADVRAIGRNGVPSISEMWGRVADAVLHDPERVAYLVNEILIIAAESYILDAEEQQAAAARVHEKMKEER